MNEFIKKMMELGAREDRACSDVERYNAVKEAEVEYLSHFEELLMATSATAITVEGEATGGINLPNPNKHRITSIEKGWGEESIYYRVGSQQIPIDEIKEEKKHIGPGDNTVYRGYNNGKLVFEMGASIDVTVRFG